MSARKSTNNRVSRPGFGSIGMPAQLSRVQPSSGLPFITTTSVLPRGLVKNSDRFGLATFISVHAMIVAPWEKITGLVSPVS